MKVLPIKTEKVYLEQFYVDEISHIKKMVGIMPCDWCTIYQNRGIAGCKSLGYCKWQVESNKINKSFTSLRKKEILDKVCSGYKNPR